VGEHLTFKPSGEPAVIGPRLLERACRSPLIVGQDFGDGSFRLVFCGNDAVAFDEHRRLQTVGGPSESLCRLEWLPWRCSLSVFAGGMEGSRRELRDYLQWVLAEFGPCRVHDEDAGCDVSVEALGDL